LRAFADVARRISQADDPVSILPSLAREARRLIGCRYTAIVLNEDDGSFRAFIPSGPGSGEMDGAAPESLDALQAIMSATGDGVGVDGLLTVPLTSHGRTVGAMYASGKDSFDSIDEALLTSLGAFAAEAFETAQSIESRRAASDALLHLRTLEDEFISAVSHEIRTPLTIIQGFAKTMQQHVEQMSPDDLRASVAGIIEGTRRLNRILGEVLDFDRVRRRAIEAHRSPTRVDGLVRMMVAESNLIGRRMLHIEMSPIVALVDAAKVERIIDALLSNLERHTPEGSQAWIRVVDEGDKVLIAVEDEGPGVPEDMRAEVLLPFRHGHSSAPAPGVGLGLSIAAEYARLHGGQLWIEGREGGGASFRVRLPKD
jgi:signal transduction histidine kinase